MWLDLTRVVPKPNFILLLEFENGCLRLRRVLHRADLLSVPHSGVGTIKSHGSQKHFLACSRLRWQPFDFGQGGFFLP